MLYSLNIENIAVIEKANVAFGEGFTVLTGETGAGKSIIIDALCAILGERTSKELIRTGCEKATVTAVFSGVGAEVSRRLENLGFSAVGEEMVVSRTLTPTKSTIKINGEVVTASALREIAPLLVDIHGQRDSDALLDPGNHYRYIDALSGESGVLAKYRAAFSRMIKTRRTVKAAENAAEERERRLKLLQFQIDEIEEAGVVVGEMDELERRKTEILNSKQISGALISATHLILSDDDGEERGAVASLEQVAQELGSVAEYSEKIAKLDEKINEILYNLRDIRDEAVEIDRSLEYDSEELSSTEQRLDMYYEFQGKYGKSEQEILDFLQKAKAEYERLLAQDTEDAAALSALPGQIEEVKTLGTRLTELRTKVAKQFSQRVSEQLKYLDMPHAELFVKVDKCAYGVTGADEIEFLISTNPGEPPKPLIKTASGGEMSRVMLAIKNVLAGGDPVPTLIFDEIDSGISGNAAAKVGNKLRETAGGKQIVCVTHLAQISCLADTHLLISKGIRDGRAVTNVEELDFEGRKRELARIIGSGVTEASLRAAEEMLRG